jgi:hypothetical protein
MLPIPPRYLGNLSIWVTLMGESTPSIITLVLRGGDPFFGPLFFHLPSHWLKSIIIRLSKI